MGPKGNPGPMGVVGRPGMDGLPGTKGNMGVPGFDGQPGIKVCTFIFHTYILIFNQVLYLYSFMYVYMSKIIKNDNLYKNNVCLMDSPE